MSDPVAPVVRWSFKPGINGGGAAVLRTASHPQGVVIVGLPDMSAIAVLDLATGEQLSTVAHVCCIGLVAEGGLVWATCYAGGRGTLVRYRLNDAAVLVERTPVDAAGNTGDWRLVALARRPSASPVLLVLTWAQRDLICVDSASGEALPLETARLPAEITSVVGICVDEAGNAVVLVDNDSSKIHVLPWPLGG